MHNSSPHTFLVVTRAVKRMCQVQARLFASSICCVPCAHGVHASCPRHGQHWLALRLAVTLLLAVIITGARAGVLLACLLYIHWACLQAYLFPYHYTRARAAWLQMPGLQRQVRVVESLVRMLPGCLASTSVLAGFFSWFLLVPGRCS